MLTKSTQTQLILASGETGAAPAPPRSVYIHVPFCGRRCGYCDFAVVEPWPAPSAANAQNLPIVEERRAATLPADPRIETYLEALEAEIESEVGVPGQPVDTVFIGGGTPTLLAPRQLERLLASSARWFELSSGAEFTVESNPNTLSVEKVAVLADHGANRVSLGAQSFQPRLLERLDRDHDPASVGRAIELIRRRIENVSLDLIFGIPSQSVAEWSGDLTEALALAPDHLSAYSLTYEKGTPLWRARRAGQVTPVGEELERQMYDMLVERLSASGFEHYEISNFARIVPDSQGRAPSETRQCRHNLVYWANLPYWGFGLGAVGYVAGARRQNTHSFDVYIERARRGQPVVTSVERLDPQRRARETAMLQLRRLCGIERAAFRRQTGWMLDDLAGPALRPFVEMGFLIDDGRRVYLSRSGLPVADAILRAIL